MRNVLVVLCSALLAAFAPCTANRAHAQPQPPASLVVTGEAGGIVVSWAGMPDRAMGRWTGWTELPWAGVMLPCRVIRVEVIGDAPRVRIDALRGDPWQGELRPANAAILQTLGGELRPDLTPLPDGRGPAGPVTILHTGRARGSVYATVAVCPVHPQGGWLLAAAHLRATVSGVQLVEAAAAAVSARPFLTDVPGPTNLAAMRPGIKMRVTQAGIQQVTGRALAAAGIDLSTLDPARLQVWHGGQGSAAEVRGGEDGQLDPDDEIRFYAGRPGDRWNAADTYWLTVESSPVPRMAGRPALSGATTQRVTAVQRGAWRENTLYDSALPGPDRDHWFTADLRAGPGQPSAVITAALPLTLPPSAGPVSITVVGSAYTAGVHHLTLDAGDFTATAAWQGTGDWSQAFVLPGWRETLTLRLAEGAQPDGVLLDAVHWEAPVILAPAPGGAAFGTPDGTFRYRITGIGGDQALYDVTPAGTPVRVDFAPADPGTFDSGPAPAAYLLAGPGTLHAPTLSRHTPVKLDAALNADAVYIAPADFLADLGALAARRTQQGYTVALVDVQAIYDAWNGGQVAPDAIRAFLRYAAATWTRPPLAAILVGDGTSDPLNYTGRNNLNLIPPYLAMVDPWLGETACDTCYGQLDGADPLDDPLPDVWIGRLPVKSSAELVALVDKLLGYESARLGADEGWRSRNVYIADNYLSADGKPDPAGDFAAFADLSVALQPPWMQVARMVYDPSPSHVGVPWREPDAAAAHQRTLALLGGGAGLANYVGHSHHWQWAVTDLAASPPYLLGMYEVDGLGNAGRLPILLEMTCLTSAFQQPAFSGTTIDERFLLAQGGAVAVWGPTGLGLMHGHDALQRGFYRALWQAQPGTARLGALTSAGYLELFGQGSDLDALRTFVLLGDPLTPARVFPTAHRYLPLALR